MSFGVWVVEDSKKDKFMQYVFQSIDRTFGNFWANMIEVNKPEGPPPQIRISSVVEVSLASSWSEQSIAWMARTAKDASYFTDLCDIEWEHDPGGTNAKPKKPLVVSDDDHRSKESTVERDRKTFRGFMPSTPSWVKLCVQVVWKLLGWCEWSIVISRNLSKDS